MAVSLSDVAKKAGVTGAAVSMALRGHLRISEARRKEIKRIATEMDYKPNLLARGLAGGRTHTVGILMAGLGAGSPPATMNIARDIVLDAIDRDYMGSIADSIGGIKIITRTLESFIERRFDGIVFQNGSYKSVDDTIVSLLKKFLSVVVINNKKESLTFDQIVHDREPAIKAMSEHFARSGRRMPIIACMEKPKSEIYIRQLKRCGINVRPEAIIERHTSIDFDLFFDVLGERLGGSKLAFDAIICNNDTNATVAMSWLRSKGLNVPKDVAVVGFDNKEGTKYLFPPLATVGRQSEKLAKLASKMLFDRLENPDLPPQCEVVPMKFILRESAE